MFGAAIRIAAPHPVALPPRSGNAIATVATGSLSHGERVGLSGDLRLSHDILTLI
jgi:hypothetical protein